MQKKFVVLRVVSRRGCRTEYEVIYNDRVLRGRVLHTRRDGKMVWETAYQGQSVPCYNPEWLCHRNGLSVNLKGHPSMRQAEAA